MQSNLSSSRLTPGYIGEWIISCTQWNSMHSFDSCDPLDVESTRSFGLTAVFSCSFIVCLYDVYKTPLNNTPDTTIEETMEYLDN